MSKAKKKRKGGTPGARREPKIDNTPYAPSVIRAANTKYKREYCQQLIDHMAQGFSYKSFAGKIGIAEKTLNNWEIHEEWRDAKELAWAKNRLWLEENGVRGIWNNPDGPTINAQMFRLHAQARFPDDWRTQVDIKAQIEGDIKAMRALSDAEIAKLAKEAVEYLEARSSEVVDVESTERVEAPGKQEAKEDLDWSEQEQ